LTRPMVFLLITALLLTVLTMSLSIEASEWQNEQVIDLSVKEAHSQQLAVGA